MTAAERARELPKNLLGLPVTVVSQVLQFSMRLQQHVTELAIKGDEVLSTVRPAEETPEWATFDEDLPAAGETPKNHNGHRPARVLRDVSENAHDPWEQEERALAEDHTDGEYDSASGEPIATADQESLAGVANYDDLSLPQLRARLRRFTLDQLEALLAYERANENRPSFVGMLARRIGNVQRLSEGDNGTGADGE